MAKPDGIDAGLSSTTPLKNVERLDYRSTSSLNISLSHMLKAFKGGENPVHPYIPFLNDGCLGKTKPLAAHDAPQIESSAETPETFGKQASINGRLAIYTETKKQKH